MQAAVKVLEDHPLTNAATGSNLTLSGTVECDAAIMSGEDKAFGSVSGVSCFKNPICVAECVMKQDRKGMFTEMLMK